MSSRKFSREVSASKNGNSTVLFPPMHVNSASGGSGPRAPPRNKMALYEHISTPVKRPCNQAVPNLWPLKTSLTTVGAMVTPQNPRYPVQNETNFSYPSYFSKPQHVHAGPLPSGLSAESGTTSLSSFHVSPHQHSQQHTHHYPPHHQLQQSSSFEYMVGKKSAPSASVSGSFQGILLHPFTEKERGTKVSRGEVQHQETSRKMPEKKRRRSLLNQPVNHGGSSVVSSRNLTHGSHEAQKHTGDSRVEVSEEETGARNSRKRQREVETECEERKELEEELVESEGGLSEQSPPPLPASESNSNSAPRQEQQGLRRSGSEGVLSSMDVMAALGQKEFWRLRKVMSSQESMFNLQLFELHRIVKVQAKLISFTKPSHQAETEAKEGAPTTAARAAQREEVEAEEEEEGETAPQCNSPASLEAEEEGEEDEEEAEGVHGPWFATSGRQAGIHAGVVPSASVMFAHAAHIVGKEASRLVQTRLALCERQKWQMQMRQEENREEEAFQGRQRDEDQRLQCQQHREQTEMLHLHHRKQQKQKQKQKEEGQQQQQHEEEKEEEQRRKMKSRAGERKKQRKSHVFRGRLEEEEEGGEAQRLPRRLAVSPLPPPSQSWAASWHQAFPMGALHREAGGPLLAGSCPQFAPWTPPVPIAASAPPAGMYTAPYAPYNGVPLYSGGRAGGSSSQPSLSGLSGFSGLSGALPSLPNLPNLPALAPPLVPSSTVPHFPSSLPLSCPGAPTDIFRFAQEVPPLYNGQSLYSQQGQEARFGVGQFSGYGRVPGGGGGAFGATSRGGQSERSTEGGSGGRGGGRERSRRGGEEKGRGEGGGGGGDPSTELQLFPLHPERGGESERKEGIGGSSEEESGLVERRKVIKVVPRGPEVAPIVAANILMSLERSKVH